MSAICLDGAGAIYALPSGLGSSRYRLTESYAAVAEGGGGFSGGGLAADAAVQLLPSLLAQLRTAEPSADMGTRIAHAFQRMSLVIRQIAALDDAVQGMGCSLVAAFAEGEELFVAHVGDCRAYVLENGTARRITRDHVLDEANDMLTRGLGHSEGSAQPEISVLRPGHGHRLLLATRRAWRSRGAHQLPSLAGAEVADFRARSVELLRPPAGQDGAVVALDILRYHHN
jgi:serine/threonine protein phosphatase PrpC